MWMDPSPTIGPRCWRQSLELLPKVGPGAGKDAAEELIQRVEELVAVATRLRGEKEATKDTAWGLRHELDTEQTSTETAASEAMLGPWAMKTGSTHCLLPLLIHAVSRDTCGRGDP